MAGALFGLAYVVLLFLALPPLVWLLWPVLRVAVDGLLWWYRLWI